MLQATGKREFAHQHSEENNRKLMHDNSVPSESSLLARYRNLRQETCNVLKRQRKRKDEVLQYTPLQGGDHFGRSIVVCRLAKSTSDPQHINHGGLPVSRVLANPSSPNHQGVEKSKPAVLAWYAKVFDSNVPPVWARSESAITGGT
jgi:hypothetical protein